MDIVRLNNIWNVQFVHGKLSVFMNVDSSFIIHQSASKPILPEGLSLEETEYLTVYMAEQSGQRVALWVYASPSAQDEIKAFVFDVYPDARIETT